MGVSATAPIASFASSRRRSIGARGQPSRFAPSLQLVILGNPHHIMCPASSVVGHWDAGIARRRVGETGQRPGGRQHSAIRLRVMARTNAQRCAKRPVLPAARSYAATTDAPP